MLEYPEMSHFIPEIFRVTHCALRAMPRPVLTLSMCAIMSKKIRYHFDPRYVLSRGSKEIAMSQLYEFIVHVCMICKRTYAMDELRPEDKNEYWQSGSITHGVCETCQEVLLDQVD